MPFLWLGELSLSRGLWLFLIIYLSTGTEEVVGIIHEYVFIKYKDFFFSIIFL